MADEAVSVGIDLAWGERNPTGLIIAEGARVVASGLAPPPAGRHPIGVTRRAFVIRGGPGWA